MSNIILLGQNNSNFEKMGSAERAHASQAVIVQSYALSALQQSTIDFGGIEKLKAIQSDLNTGIGKSQDHAKFYLDKLLPDMIHQSTNLDAFLNLQTALPMALDPKAPASEAIAMMKAVQEQAQDHRTSSKTLVTNLQKLRTDISGDATVFKSNVLKMNGILEGDNGVLAVLDEQVDKIDSKINWAIAGIAGSGLAVAGGVLLVCVGSVGSFITAGTSSVAVVAGASLILGGVAGGAALTYALIKYQETKAELVNKQKSLKNEVKAVSGVCSQIKTLASGASNAASATQDMANAWTILEQDMGSLITNLEKGQTTVDGLRKLYQQAAKGTVATLKLDNATIQKQLTGVDKKYAPEGTDLFTFAKQEASKAA